MDFTVKRKVIRPSQIGSLLELYPHDLQLYRLPPMHNITLQEFEELAIERLKVLRILSSVSVLKGFKMYSSEWKNAVTEELIKEGLKSYAHSCKSAGFSTLESDLQFRKRDHVSHFILRLAYCRSEELRRWFISRELELFKIRFQSLTPDGVKMFFKFNNLQYSPISDEEKLSVINSLYESTLGYSHGKIETFSFYKVKFNEVLDLVKSRKVFLQNGYAYVPNAEFVSVISSQYRSHINQALAVASRKLPEVEHDERVVALLKGLHNAYTGADYDNSSKATICIESLDALSVKAFPLCMRQLHEHLRSEHHMKHGGRLQYGLFLKAIGVTLEDSLRFWREEFTKKIDLESFEKKYSYNVRYNYGKEGSRKNFSAYSCMRIIQGNVGPGDNHGCPFRHSDVAILKNKLLAYGTNPQGISTIVDLVKKGHYQVACSKYFDVTHNSHIELGVNHPNQYFEESQNLATGHGKQNVEVKTERTYVYGQNTQNSAGKEDTSLIEDDLMDAEFASVDMDI